jgi:hypothetical protein
MVGMVWKKTIETYESRFLITFLSEANPKNFILMDYTIHNFNNETNSELHYVADVPNGA